MNGIPKRDIKPDDLGKELQFTVVSQMQGKGKKSNKPYIRLGIRCYADDGHELDLWVNHFFSSAYQPNQRIELFAKFSDKSPHIMWDGEFWNGYTDDAFLGAKGICTIKKEENNGYVGYSIDRFIEREYAPISKGDTIEDEEIPF